MRLATKGINHDSIPQAPAAAESLGYTPGDLAGSIAQKGADWVAGHLTSSPAPLPQIVEPVRDDDERRGAFAASSSRLTRKRFGSGETAKLTSEKKSFDG